MRTWSQLSLFALCVFASYPTFAQINITTTDINARYAVGKGEYQLSSDTTKYSMNVGSASVSSAQSWTIPTVQYADTLMFKNAAPTSTPYTASFPSATHAQTVTLQGGGTSIAYYAYTRIANDSLFELGFALREISGTHDTTMYDYRSRFVVKLPIELGSVVTSRDSNYYGPGDYEVRTGIETFDAFGTITLPNGTFQCLRLKRLEHTTIAHSGVPLDTFTVCRFTWMTKEGHQASATSWRNDQTAGTIQVVEIRYSQLIDVPTSVRDGQSAAPATFVLQQNYPNPFNPSTTIRFTLAEETHITLAVYDELGREVAVLVNDALPSGLHHVVWNASRMASGVYFYSLQAGSFRQTRRLILVR